MLSDILEILMVAFNYVTEWTMSVFDASGVFYFVIGIIITLAVWRILILPAISTSRLSDTAKRVRSNSKSGDDSNG